MHPERWQRLESLFQEAIERKPDERRDFLSQACAGDPSLRAEIEQLIAGYEKAGTFIEGSPALTGATLLVPEPEEEAVAGRRLGAYELIREIGRGGMGVVYLAARADEEFLKRVAIKLVLADFDHESINRRFRNERQILASLDHPNIARLLDGGTTEGGSPFFVMEYIEGQPIKDYCDSQRLSTVERLKLFRAVCSAVHYAHQNLIVHRDIKPGNILVTVDRTPKLLDFGIAKLISPDAQLGEITEATSRVMTPDYASPEQARGEHITTASDVYSLGVLLYELLTGHRPYRVTSRSPLEIIQAICEQEPDKPSTAIARTQTAPGGEGQTTITLTPETVSRARNSEPGKLRRQLMGDLDNIVLKAMRKEAPRRYASVEQLSEDIRRHLEGLPVTARKDTLSYRAGKFVRRHKAAVAAAIVVFIALLAATGVTLRQARVALVERDKAERRFNQVRKLANAVMFKYHDGIQELPGSTPVREMLVKDALEYLDGLAQEATGDASLQRELATAYEKVGDVQGDPYSASLGDTTGALASHRKSLAIREALLAADPSSAGVRGDLASSYLKLGDILWLGGDWNSALDVYLKARDINEALAAADPSNSRLRSDLALNYVTVGDTLIETGDLPGALVNQRKALAIREELAASASELKAKINVGVSHTKVADTLTRIGQKEECLMEYEKSVGTFEALLAVDPSSVPVRRYLVNTAQRLGEALLKYGEMDRALVVLRKGAAIAESLAAADPADAVARRNLNGAYSSLAHALLKKRDYPQSLAMYRKTLEIALATSAADPSNAQARRDVMVAYNQIGSVLDESNNLPEAEQSYRKALAIGEALSAADHTTAQPRNDLADLYQELGRISAKRDASETALELHRKALALRESLASESPANADFSGALADSCLDLGKMLTMAASSNRSPPGGQLRLWTEARALFQRSQDIYLKLKDSGALTKDQASNLGELANEVARCDAAMSRFRAR